MVMVEGLTSKGSAHLNGQTGVVLSSSASEGELVRLFSVRLDESGATEHFVDTHLRICQADDRPKAVLQAEAQVAAETRVSVEAAQEAEEQAELAVDAQRAFLHFVCGEDVRLMRGTALSVQPLAISDDYGAGDAAVGIWGARSGSAAFAIGATVEAQLAAASTRAAAQLRSLLPELPRELYPLRNDLIDAGITAREIACWLYGGVVEGVLDTIDAVETANGAGITAAMKLRKGLRSTKETAKARVGSTVGWLRRRRLRELFSEHDPGEEADESELSAKDLLSVLHSPKECMSSQSAPGLLPSVGGGRLASASTAAFQDDEDPPPKPNRTALRLPFLKRR
jgi:hypothetical protein